MYQIVWVDAQDSAGTAENDHSHYAIYFNEDEVHEHVGSGHVELSYSSTHEIFAHEFIHFLSIADEYGKPKGSAALVRYYQPDGTLAPNMVVFSRGFKKHGNDKRWNIMSSNDSTNTEVKHAWNIAIEAQELMRAETGREIKCDIVRQ